MHSDKVIDVAQDGERFTRWMNNPRVNAFWEMAGPQAEQENLARELEGLRCKVNLLAYNEHEGAPFERPTDEAVFAFSERLRSLGVDAFVRRTRGRDIAAACGQLAVGPRRKGAGADGPPAA